MPEEKQPDLCPGCGHLMSMHFRDVRGVARCLVVASGVSTSGIIGEPWSCGCDCQEFVSQRAVCKAKEAAARQEEWEHETANFVEAVRWKKGPFDWVI